MLITRRSNCTNTASGILTFCKWPSGMQVKPCIPDGHLERVTIPDAVLVQFDLLMMSTNKSYKRICSSQFLSSHLVCCLFHVQGAILTTMLATRNFSSKYDGHGKYLRTPRTKKNGRNSLFLRQSHGIAWSLPFTRNLCFRYSPCLC